MSTVSNEGVKTFEHRQRVVGFLILLAFIFASILVTEIQMNTVAEQSTRFISRMVQLQEFREIGLTLEDARLNYFKEVHYVSKQPGRSFDLPAGQKFTPYPGALGAFIDDSVTIPVSNPLDSSNKDHIVYVFNRFRFAPYAALMWLILVLISLPQTRIMKMKVEQQYEKELALERGRAQVAVAKEVRHNLRSPLAALMRIPSRLPDSVKKDRELLQSTINQIRALVARLGHSGDAQLSEDTSDEIYDSLMQSVQEISLAVPTRIQFIPEIDEALVSAKVPHIPHEIRALLGNIVNNSAEAISGRGTILLRATDLASDVEIQIQDSGIGIPADILDRIFDEGFSHGKEKGTGTGLFHAKRWIEAWGGRIEAHSTPNEMTTITIQLPVEERASWYVPRIRIQKDQPVIVVEDQESARGLWRLRLDEAGIKNAKILPSANEFRALAGELKSNQDVKPVFFFDYDLGSGPNGLDLFADVDDGTEKYLVTGHFDDSTIRRRCETEHVHLLPKSLLPEVPIVVV